MKNTFYLAALLATSCAYAAEKVTDGSFENIAASPYSCLSGTQGPWTFTGRTCLLQEDHDNGGTGPQTPYGLNYLDFFSHAGSPGTGVATQKLKGLTSGTYTLSYAYLIVHPATKDCTFTTTYGSQTIDTLVLPHDAVGSETNWVTHTASFKPAKLNGPLSITLNCPPPAKPQWVFGLDNISIVGPS